MKIVEPIRDKRIIAVMKQELKERGEKYYIMFLVGINLGLRINEILSLRVGDVKGRRETVVYQKKTGKEVAVAFNDELYNALSEYCRGRNDEEALIPHRSNKYKSIGRVWAYKVLKSTAERFGIEHIGTHTLRKTCGYHFYNQTKDIATLMVWFNHDNEADTLRYIGITRERIRRAMVDFKL